MLYFFYFQSFSSKAFMVLDVRDVTAFKQEDKILFWATVQKCSFLGKQSRHAKMKLPIKIVHKAKHRVPLQGQKASMQQAFGQKCAWTAARECGSRLSPCRWFLSWNNCLLWENYCRVSQAGQIFGEHGSWGMEDVCPLCAYHMDICMVAVSSPRWRGCAQQWRTGRKKLQLLSSSCSSLLSPDSCRVVWYMCENFDKLFLHNFQREDEKSFWRAMDLGLVSLSPGVLSEGKQALISMVVVR